MRRRYEEMTTTEMSAEGAGLADAVAVVPIAAIEQHGPHLPLGTDAMLAAANMRPFPARSAMNGRPRRRR